MSSKPEAEYPFDRDVERLIAEAIRSQLLPNESLADAMAGAKHLALKRAAFLGRRVITDIDLEHVMKCCTWWPFKPGLPYDLEQYLHRYRPILFRGAADGDTRLLDASVQNAVLLLEAEGLRALQLHGKPEDFCKPPPEAQSR
jgi:hypothetical protein